MLQKAAEMSRMCTFRHTQCNSMVLKFKCAFNKCMRAAPVATLELQQSNVYKALGVHLWTSHRMRPKLM